MRLDGQADLAELDVYVQVCAKNIAAALAELDTLQRCIDAIRPLRKFAHLPDPEAHEAAQHDEWKLELIHRAENYLLTTGTISPDHFVTMRQHPAFMTEILPAIETIKLALGNTDSVRALLASGPAFAAQLLLANKE